MKLIIFSVYEDSYDELFDSSLSSVIKDETHQENENCVDNDNDSKVDSEDDSFGFESNEDSDYNSYDDSDNNRNKCSTESCSSSYEEDTQQKNDKNFKSLLIQWSLLYNISLVALTALLVILKQFTNYLLPRCARTLLRTPRTTNIIQMSDGGEYLHLGVRQAIDSILKHRTLRKINSGDSINLFVNIDGLPIHKASKKSLWLILCSEENSSFVYLIGAYYREHHPEDSNEFLAKFTEEMKAICRDGVTYEGQKIEVNLKGLICDAPAKSMVLNVKGHSGYNSCSKCKIKGEGIQPKTWRKNQKKKRRVCFPGTGPFAQRTDNEFAENKYMGTYQKNPTILTEIPRFGAVSNVLLDYLHLVLLGVMKTIIFMWLKGPPSVKLSPSAIDKISVKLLELRKSQPSDFARRPRSLRDLKQWKGTEFRNFLLYSGPIVLKDVLKENIYDNFMALHVAITILSSPTYTRMTEYIDYAQKLIVYFIQTFQTIYGKEFMSHNFHNLLHLCDEVKKFGHLDVFSAFKFENFMTDVKKKLRKNNKPLQQLSRRYAEMQAFKESNLQKPAIVVKQQHFDGPILKDYEAEVTKQYKQFYYGPFFIDCNTLRNNCALLKDGYTVTINNIVEIEKNIYLIGKKDVIVEDLYESPMKSNYLNIHVVRSPDEDEFILFPLQQLKAKCWRIRRKHNLSIILPILHTVCQD